MYVCHISIDYGRKDRQADQFYKFVFKDTGCLSHIYPFWTIDSYFE